MKRNWLNRLGNSAKSYFNLILSNDIRLHLLQALPFWIASLLVGLIAVAYTKLFGLAEELLEMILKWNSWMIFIMAPVCFMLALLIVQVFAPNAKGSGIPQVMAAIDLANPKHNNKIFKLLSLRILVTKIASSLMMILGGAPVGREGPTIQIAGSVFRFVNNSIPRSWPKVSDQGYILTGAAAGLAAAFNTPLGGIIFAMEELSKTHVRFFRTALFSAVIIAGLTAQALLGPYLYLGYPNVKGLGFQIFFGVAVTAVISGMLGSLMCKVILKVMHWKRQFSKGKMFLFVLAAGLAISSLAFFLNMHILGSGKELMNELLFTSHKVSSFETVVMRLIGPIIAFNTGAAGGVFAPSLAAGAAVGGLINDISQMQGPDANILVLSGMVGFLTGVTRTPFTSAILVLEMTDRHSVIFQLMLAALLSNIAALVIDKKSFYEQLKKGYIEDILHQPKSTSSP